MTLTKQIRSHDLIEVGFYHNLIDHQNDARDLFTGVNASSNDYSQYRDIYSSFRPRSVVFTIVPVLLNTSINSDCAMGLFGVRQGIYEGAPVTQSVSTVIQYPGTKGLHNLKPLSVSFPFSDPEWFSNTETNTATSRVFKLTYYCAWYKVATTNTAQAIVQVRVVLEGKGKLI